MPSKAAVIAYTWFKAVLRAALLSGASNALALDSICWLHTCNVEGGLQARMGTYVYMKWGTAIYPSSTCLRLHMTTQLA